MEKHERDGIRTRVENNRKVKKLKGTFQIHVFFYKHNVYKHTEAQISKKLSIF